MLQPQTIAEAWCYEVEETNRIQQTLLRMAKFGQPMDEDTEENDSSEDITLMV